MTRAEARHERRFGVHRDVPRGGDERPALVDDEGAVELRELLDGLAELRPSHVEQLVRVPVERIEQERLRPVEHGFDVADHEQRPDLAALASFPGDLDGELHDLLDGLAHRFLATRAVGHRAEDPLEVGHTG